MLFSGELRQFSDYRAFLLAHAQKMKAQNPHWTYGAWARHLNLKTTSSITKIIQGERNAGDDITSKLIRYFAFSPEDAQYFRDLIRLHKIKKDPRLALVLMEKMQKDQPEGAVRILNEKEFSVISNWYCYAIREMVNMNRFFENPHWISQRLQFKASPREVTHAIDSLIAVGLLKRNKKRKLEIHSPIFDTPVEYATEARWQQHEQMLENAKIALRTIPANEREITNSTIVMKESDIPQAKEMIRNFKKRFCKTFEQKGGTGVYQVQIQLFPLTKPLKSQNTISENTYAKIH